jgi:hypothetical protein
MFGWGQKAETTVGALSKERERLAIVAEELDLRRRDAATAYATGIEQRLPRGRLRALLGIRQSVERRLETVARLQLKLDQNIEALESTQLVTSVLGSLKLGTSVLSKVPGKEGDAFGAVDDNAIALDEVSELTGAVSGAYDPVDDDLEAELDRDLGVGVGDAPGIQDGPVKGVPGDRDRGTTVGGGALFNGASGGNLDLPSAPTAVPESSFHNSGRGAGVAPVVSREQLLEMSRRPPRLAGFGS